MLKRSATLLVLLMTLALAAFGQPYFGHLHNHDHADGQNKGKGVPEPGSLLVFGSGLLLSFKALGRKT